MKNKIEIESRLCINRSTRHCLFYISPKISTLNQVCNQQKNILFNYKTITFVEISVAKYIHFKGNKTDISESIHKSRMLKIYKHLFNS